MKTTKMILAAIMISAGTTVMAQQQPAQHNNRPQKTFTPEQAKEMRWQKVSEKMMLSDAESAKVKPVYDEYLEELRALHPNHNKKDAKADNANKPEAKADKANKPERKPATDAEIEKMVKSKLEIERKQIDIKEKYFDKFCKLLNPRQAKYLVESANVMHQGGRKGFQSHAGFQGAHKGFQGQGMMNQGNRRPGMNGMPFGPNGGFGNGQQKQHNNAPKQNQ